MKIKKIIGEVKTNPVITRSIIIEYENGKTEEYLSADVYSWGDRNIYVYFLAAQILRLFTDSATSIQLAKKFMNEFLVNLDTFKNFEINANDIISWIVYQKMVGGCDD